MMPEHVDRFDQPLTYNPRPVQSLPSINDLEFGLRKCPEPSCRKFLQGTGSCGDHHHVPQNMTSSIFSLGDTSSDSEPSYTPNASRATSPNSFVHAANAATNQRRRSLKVAARQGSRRSSLHLDQGKELKKIKKMEKEKAGRSQQAAVLSRLEDSFRNYCNWERREQSGGNGNGAGLTANKINLLRAVEVTCNLFLHQQYCEAMQRGPGYLDDWQRTMQRMLTSAPDDAPFEGTFLSGTDAPCAHLNPKAKGCLTHGTADWRDCRILQSRARFEEQKSWWIRANIPRDQHDGLTRAKL